MGPWTHTQFGYNKSDTGDLTFPDNQHDIFSRYMFHDMINKYTKDDSDKSFDRWPTVSYYVMSDVDDRNFGIDSGDYSLQRRDKKIILTKIRQQSYDRKTIHGFHIILSPDSGQQASPNKIHEINGYLLI